jgi:hypothetical protein
MSTSSVTLADSAAANNTFLLRDQSNGLSTYVDPDTSLAFPLGFSVQHTVKPAGQLGTDRHLIKVFQTKTSADYGTVTAVVSVQISVPRHDLVNDTVMADLWAYAKNYLDSAGSYAKLIDGITP